MAQCTPKSFDLTGKVALITGASYGIGMAIAKAMAANGATIVFNDIKQELVDKGIAAYEEAGIKAHGYVCDVTDEDAVNAMVAKITEEVGHINILVNNAGIIKRIPMTEMTAAQFRQVIDVDLNAPFIVAKAVIPDMIAQGGGKIINICSMMSELGRETVSAYAAAKGGLKMLTKNIASEYGEYNIQCNGIGPGYIATPQTAPLRERQPDGSRHPFDSFIVAKTPAGYYDLLQQARMDNDSEVVHYASTALSQITKEADLKLQKLEQRYAAAPDDAAVLEEYCDYLESYLKDGFVQGRAAEIQRHQLEQLLKKRLEDLDGRRSCMLECRLAEVQLRLAEYDRAEKTLEELTARWPQREAPWMLRLRLAAALRDGEAIQKTLGQIEEKEVYLSARGREIVRFWQGKQQ